MKTMLNIGDYAIHKTTGNFGQVVAYGHEIVDSVYLATLKVEVIDNTGMSKKTFVEDITSNWLPIKKEEAPGYKISLKLPSESSKVLTRV
jgi:hypothetical protein